MGINGGKRQGYYWTITKDLFMKKGEGFILCVSCTGNILANVTEEYNLIAKRTFKVRFVCCTPGMGGRQGVKDSCGFR